MLTATKARPALARAGSSFNAGSNSRAASTLASTDIFDNPGRLIFEENPATNAPPSASRRYYPSHFRPLPQQSDAQQCSSSSVSTAHCQQSNQHPHPHVHPNPAQARQMSTLAHHQSVTDGSSILFDGPARPRHPPRITARRERVRASSSAAVPSHTSEDVGAKNFVPMTTLPDPILYDGPACPPRRVPVQLRKSSERANMSSSVVAGTVVAAVGLAAAYEIHDANQGSQPTPKNVLSYSRSRENVTSPNV